MKNLAIFASGTGTNFTAIAAASVRKELDARVALLVCDKPVKARFVRIVNCGQLDGKFSLFDLRVFGFAPGKAPAKPEGIVVIRIGDRRNIEVDFSSVPDATGYIVRWGTEAARPPRT